MLTVYAYQGCSTCRNAQKWLQQHAVSHQLKAIRDTPPGVAEVKTMMKARGGMRALFNTSGQDYRALGIKDQLPTMSEDEAVRLLASNGNLIKRPFAIDQAKGVFLTGFREEEWAAALLK